MRTKKKGLFAFLLVTLLLLVSAMPVFAASAPGNVKNLKQKAISETSVKLTWSKVSGASGYMIYSVDTSTGAEKKIATKKATNHTLKKIVPNTTYQYKVYAYKKSGSETLRSEVPATITVKTSIKTPANPSGFAMSARTSTTVTLKWNSAKNANGYIVYKVNSTTGKLEKYKQTKEKKLQVTGLKEGVEVKFALQAVRTVSGQQKLSAKVSYVTATPKGLSAAAKTIHGRWFNATLRSTVTGTTTDGKKVTIKKGTKVTSTGRTSGQIIVILKNGTRVRVSGKSLRYNSINYSKTYYSNEALEAYVNEKGYSSNTKSLIWISQYTCSVTIFKGSKGNWKVSAKMPCVIGKDGKTSVGDNFKLLFRDYAYGGPRVYFTWNAAKSWGNSFHLRVDGHTRGAYSHGCIRLSKTDLDKVLACGLGTRVISY